MTKKFIFDVILIDLLNDKPDHNFPPHNQMATKVNQN